MRLFDSELSRRQIASFCGATTQFFGVQLASLGDGAERGVRTLEFRTGTGFRFTVLIDRAFDIGLAEFRGVPIGWHSPTGFRHPGLHEYGDDAGVGWLRSFSGLMVTAGLDHILFNAEDDASQYRYAGRPRQAYTLHGRVSNLPGRLDGYGEHWDGDQCTLWCEGTIVQAAVFGEHLHLVRRIEARVGESRFTVRDRVVNRGFSRTPHMLLYHINLGYPLLDAGSRYIAPVRHTLWASHEKQLRDQGVGYLTQPRPTEGFVEQVFEHSLAADGDGRVPAALVNRGFANGRGIGFAVEVNKREFPCHFQWQCYAAGLYSMALEPSTNHVLGRLFARDRGELRWLEHGEEAAYTTVMNVLEDNSQIDAFEARVAAICPPRTNEIPEITGAWEPL